MAYPTFRTAQTGSLRLLQRRLANNESDPMKKSLSGHSAGKGLSSAASELAYKFGKRSTIHGMNRFLSQNAGKWEKFIWFITLVLAFIGSVYVCLILSKRFTEGKFETVVDNTNEPVYTIYFPVVTICNRNRLNWARIEEVKRRFLPGEMVAEKVALFERVLGAYDDVTFANFDSFAVLQNESLAQLDAVNFTNVVDVMSWRCEELLSGCVWNHEAMDCCTIFSRRKTKRGFCWAFNTLESDEGRLMQRLDPLWPWHTGGSGPNSGLNVRVHVHPTQHYPARRNEKGIDVMITEPQVWHKDPYIIEANTQTIIEIEPVVYFYDNDTRSVSSDQRQCVFDDERNSRDFRSLQGFIYMIENCQSECHQQYLMRYCNCSMDLLFPPGPYPACKATDLLCLAKNNAYFLYSHQPGEEEYVRTNYEGMECKCFRNCYSLNYVNEVRPSFLPAEAVSNDSYVDLDVHYRFNTMMVYRTRLVFGWVDLLVAFGGIAGLFLGCSLISAMELAYFAAVELPYFIYNELKEYRSGSASVGQLPAAVAARAWTQTQFGENFNGSYHHNNLHNSKAAQAPYYPYKGNPPKFGRGFGGIGGGSLGGGGVPSWPALKQIHGSQ